jgi:hypothetical protein
MANATKYRVLIGVCMVAMIAALMTPRIAQDPLYHLFADNRNLFEIPNALNVFSNLLFAWIGFEGLYRLMLQDSLQITRGIYPAYLSFFVALVLIALGSGYYHWSPDNQTLIWDRLPMTIAFMSFFTILVAERISLALARRMLPLLIALGVASVAYWHLSEQAGQGDLRPYLLIQFLPVLLTPMILLMLDSGYSRSSDIWWFFGWYLLAKVFEALDDEILDLLRVVSGHSLKHIAASISCLAFLRHLRLRRLTGR